MGAFRILLCWLVIAAHVDPAATGAVCYAGPFALFSFYAVSGYYMTLSLRTIYATPGGLRAYYWNRALRLLPLYLVLLAVAAPLAFANANPTHAAWSALGPCSRVTAAAGQVLPFGQESFHWFHVVNGALVFTKSFRETAVPAWHLLFLPTCWSLSLECWFFIVAPFLVRRGISARLAVAAASLGVWGLVFALGLPQDPWIYRVFPAALVFFMAGSLARTIHERFAAIVEKARARPALITSGMAAYFALVVAWRLAAPRFPGTFTIALLAVLYALGVAAIPFLFVWSNGNPRRQRIDKYLADLAYPIFLFHYPILRLTGWNSPLLILAATAATGAVALSLVSAPLARFKSKPASAPK